jgi:hypothetical protein
MPRLNGDDGTSAWLKMPTQSLPPSGVVAVRYERSGGWLPQSARGALNACQIELASNLP